MKTQTLGASDLNITRIGFGAWAVGGDWQIGWGAQDDNDSIAAIHRSLELGVNWIDTAAVYGLGHSEEVVGRAIKGLSETPYIFTKSSIRWNEKGEIFRTMRASSIREECEQSLRRLGVETIDLYQIHWPIPDAGIEEGWTEMAKLQQEGKVRYLGVSNFNVEQLKRAQAIAPVTSLQPPYSLIKRDVDAEILPYCKEQNIGVIVYSPMQSGLLTGAMSKERMANLADTDWRSKDEEFQEPRLSRNLALADLLGDIGSAYDCSAGEVAIAWTLHNPAVTAAIVGGRNAKQVEGVVGGADLELSANDLERISAFLHENP